MLAPEKDASKVNARAITISGEVASGKSLLAAALAALVPGWTRVNTGQRFRELCASRGLSIRQVSRLPDGVHRAFDASQAELLRTASRAIVEGRLSGWLARDLQDVYRVFCHAPLATRVERCANREQIPPARARAQIQARDTRDREKFHQVHGLADYRDPGFYHLWLDTSTEPPADLARQIARRAGLAGLLSTA